MVAVRKEVRRRISSRRFASVSTRSLSSSLYSSKRSLTDWCPRKVARGRTNDPKGEPADHSRWPFAEKRRRDGGMTRRESEKKGFVFPRTKHSLVPLVFSTLNSSSSRSRVLLFYTFFPTPSSSAPFPSLFLRAVQLFVVFSHLFSFLLSLLFYFAGLILLHLASSQCVCFLVSWSILLPHSLALPFSHLSFLSLYSSCQLIKPVDLPSQLFPFVIEIYELACSRSPFQSILRSS